MHERNKRLNCVRIAFTDVGYIIFKIYEESAQFLRKYALRITGRITQTLTIRVETVIWHYAIENQTDRFPFRTANVLQLPRHITKISPL